MQSAELLCSFPGAEDQRRWRSSGALNAKLQLCCTMATGYNLCCYRRHAGDALKLHVDDENDKLELQTGLPHDLLLEQLKDGFEHKAWWDIDRHRFLVTLPSPCCCESAASRRRSSSRRHHHHWCFRGGVSVHGVIPRTSWRLVLGYWGSAWSQTSYRVMVCVFRAWGWCNTLTSALPDLSDWWNAHKEKTLSRCSLIINRCLRGSLLKWILSCIFVCFFAVCRSGAVDLNLHLCMEPTCMRRLTWADQ